MYKYEYATFLFCLKLVMLKINITNVIGNVISLM